MSSEYRSLFNNRWLDILATAAEMLAGEIDYRKANYDETFAHVRKAIELDDSLPRTTSGACTAITSA